MEKGARVDYVKGGVKLPLGKRHQVVVPPEVLRVRLTGLLFDTNKCFLLPVAIHGMRALKRIFDRNPSVQLLVTGHTDRKFTDAFNVELSQERAAAMAAYLRDDVEVWISKYAESVHEKKRWGTLEDQHMLATVAESSGAFEKIDVDGIAGAKTTAAIRAFQEFSNDKRATQLKVDGKAGDATRRELIAAYMAQPGTTLPPGAVLQTHGCGPFHNAVPNPPDTSVAENRRAEIFFFEDGIRPAPRTPCPGPDGCPEFDQWVKASTRTVDLDRGAGTLTVRVSDGKQPIAGAPVHVDGPVPDDGTTDAAGTARFDELPAGDYAVSASPNGFETATGTASVLDGAQADADLKALPKRAEIQLQFGLPLPQKPDSFVYRLFSADAPYDQTHKLSENAPLSQGQVALTFTAVPPSGTYSLTCTLAPGVTYEVFSGITFDRLLDIGAQGSGLSARAQPLPPPPPGEGKRLLDDPLLQVPVERPQFRFFSEERA